MEMLKLIKLGVLTLALASLAGCPATRSGDTTTQDENLGMGSAGSTRGTGQDDGSGYGYGSGQNGVSGTEYDRTGGSGGAGGALDDEAALRAITTFYFDYDSSELKPEAMRSLDVHARDLKASGARVTLEGHTDERGTREYNMALGERRAQVVQRYLVLQGVSPSQLEVVSWGEERPEVLGSDEYAWAQNRRVELRR